MTAILQLRDATPNVCQAVQVLIAERLADLERRMADLRHVQRVLQATLKRCHETQWQGRCQVFDKLAATSHP